jgi:hypothetical protein
MPILDLQQRARELGRIRIGQVVTGSNGKTRPEKLDRFRLTSASQELITQVAALYGGAVDRWTPQGGGAPGWEVVTTSTRLPVLVPPQPVSQWYETWSGGGCQRRCDGLREVLTDAPCICGPDPAERLCKPTTRLNVVLAEVEGVGVWRLETHGYYAAVELPSAAELLAAANGYIRGHLALEERVVKRDGKTKRFMVPTLEVGVTPAELMAGGGRADTPAIEAPKPVALPAAPSGEPQLDVDNVRAALAAAPTIEVLRDLWPEAKAAGLEAEAKRRASELAIAEHSTPVPAPTSDDPDELWSTILRTVPTDWTLPQVEREFANFTGTPAEVAGASDMRDYLQHLAAS